jgi:hypothetical protein
MDIAPVPEEENWPRNLIRAHPMKKEVSIVAGKLRESSPGGKNWRDACAGNAEEAARLWDKASHANVLVQEDIEKIQERLPLLVQYGYSQQMSGYLSTAVDALTANRRVVDDRRLIERVQRKVSDDPMMGRVALQNVVDRLTHVKERGAKAFGITDFEIPGESALAAAETRLPRREVEAAPDTRIREIAAHAVHKLAYPHTLPA